jgi:membrane-associated phospholipid phosphatase
MRALGWWRGWPHEVLLAGLGALIALALLVHGAWEGAGRVAGAVALYLLAVGVCAGRGVWWTRLRLGAAYGYTLWIYEAIRWITPALELALRDAELEAIDVWALGCTPALAWEAYASAPLTELMSACYMSYHVYLHGALIWALRDVERARRLYVQLFIAFALGIGGYLLVPAVGPVRALTFAGPLPGGPITRFQDAFIAGGTSIYDVFPSLHILLTLSLLLHDRVHHRARFWLMAPVAVGLAASTLYLRYHYAVDLVAGAGLAVCVWLIVGRSACGSARRSSLPERSA